MEFTSSRGAVIGYSLVLLLFRLGCRWPAHCTRCRLLGENADKLCFLHDNSNCWYGTTENWQI